MNVKIHDIPRNVAIGLENVCKAAGVNTIEDYADNAHELFDFTLMIDDPGIEVKINRQYFCLYYPEGELVKVHRIHLNDFSEVTII